MTGNLFPAQLSERHEKRKLNTNFRRNGKLQSCEPCRKGKLRCDHMTPTCGRCNRRNKAEQCVYHPAPLTKRGNLPTPPTESDHSSPSALLRSEELCAPAPTTYLAPRREIVPVSQPSLDINPAAGLQRAIRATSLPAQPWLSPSYEQQSIDELRRPLPEAHVSGDSILQCPVAGFVHHTAVLDENELSIGISQAPGDGPPTAQVSPLYIERGAAVLTVLKDLPILQKYIDKWFSFAKGIVLVEPMVKIFTSGIWSTWSKTLKEQNAKALRKMSEKIWENTLRPASQLLSRNTSPREFCFAVTGENIRWEIVGITVTLVALLCQSLSDGDPIFCSHDEPLEDRAALILKMHNASEICLNLCEDFAIVNDLYLWFLYQNTILYCSLRTRGSFENWKKSSVLSTALTFFNLHQEIKVDDNTPFFIAELRKRLFVSAYDNDKHSSIYNGRPPRLTRQYCMLQLPLDLSDTQIMLEGPDLESAVASLDGSGWNPTGQVQCSTFARLFVSNSLIAEEILEISMGSHPREEIIRRAADIERRSVEHLESLPEFLRIGDQPFTEMKRAPIELLYMAFIRLDYLNHHFLLQRTLVKKIGADHSKLLSTSQEMFSFIVLLVNHKDVFRDFQVDMLQLLTYNGIPSAAIIAMELLHQEQNPTSASVLTNPLPRSSTIQDLSVFVACLGTVKPWTNASTSCNRGRKFLKKILDTILDPEPALLAGDDPSAQSLGDVSFTSPLFQTGNDGDFMRWLDTMEFECDGWVNFN